MKIAILSLICLVIAITCNTRNSKSYKIGANKGFSSIILREANFIVIDLKIITKSADEILADISYTNTSYDTILLYKKLLPINDNIENIFSIFSNKNFDIVSYKGNSTEEYMKTAPEDDQGVIKPELNPENFIKLNPKDKIDYEINLANSYDFKSFLSKHENNFSITPSVSMPLVTKNYEQVYETDPTDNNVKPVYLDLTLPKKHSIDSMRVQFEVSVD